MKITCLTCKAVYNIPSHKIPEGKKASAKCKKCGDKIVVEAKIEKIKPEILDTVPLSRNEVKADKTLVQYPKCLRCGYEETAEIIYGFPLPEEEDEIEEGQRVVFGGCEIGGEFWSWHCCSCQFKWLDGEDLDGDRPYREYTANLTQYNLCWSRKEYEFKSQPVISIGGDSSCDICFPECLVEVRMRHAEIRHVGNQLKLESIEGGFYIQGIFFTEAILRDFDDITFTKNASNCIKAERDSPFFPHPMLHVRIHFD